MRLVCGDIGGTHARLAAFEIVPRELGGASLTAAGERQYASREHANLEQIVRTFQEELPGDYTVGAFGLPGPVRDGRCRTTNLPWLVDAEGLAAAGSLQRVLLLNDLEASAWALDALPAESLRVLTRGEPTVMGNAALIAAGTGLGEAGLAWDGVRRRPFATEGGHASFAPTNDLELALLEFLLERFEHVSWERLLSGPGLVHIYEFLCEHRGARLGPWLEEADERGGDLAARISRAGLEGRDDLAAEALDVFVRLYGAEAGNLALKTMATAGIYLGGGIAPKILPKLEDGAFLEAFVAKGRMRPLLEAIPVTVVLDENAALMGAARAALASVPRPRT